MKKYLIFLTVIFLFFSPLLGGAGVGTAIAVPPSNPVGNSASGQVLYNNNGRVSGKTVSSPDGSLTIGGPQSALTFAINGPSVKTVNGQSGAVALNSTSIISNYNWASLPVCAAGIANVVAHVTDIGTAGSDWRCDGVSMWRPVNGNVTLDISEIPFIIPSNGTIGSNGALSGITTLPTTFSGGAYVYFPANAITGSNAAGLYWTVFSSGAAGTVYNNTYSGGDPAAPASLTAFSGTTGQSYTQNTGSWMPLATFTVKGGLMGTQGELRTTSLWETAGTSNNKFIAPYFGATTNPLAGVGGVTVNSSSSPGYQFLSIMRNAESQSAQVSSTAWGSNMAGGTISRTGWNTAIDQTYGFMGKISTATDFVILTGWDLVLRRP